MKCGPRVSAAGDSSVGASKVPIGPYKTIGESVQDESETKQTKKGYVIKYKGQNGRKSDA